MGIIVCRREGGDEEEGRKEGYRENEKRRWK
jgi:hypothetical protein